MAGFPEFNSRRNIRRKMAHAGIARGTTVGLSVPISLTSYRG